MEIPLFTQVSFTDAFRDLIKSQKYEEYVSMIISRSNTIFMSYKMRCKYYHAEKALPLICFVDEHPLPVLRVLNVILEHYLDENLYRWFDNSILQASILPKISVLAENCVCDKQKHLISCVVDGINRA